MPAGASFAWTAPAKLTALAPQTVAPDLVNPATSGTGPIATWVDNPTRTSDAASVHDVLFVLDAGTLQNGSVHVAASVANVQGLTSVEVTLPVLPSPLGDPRRGRIVYESGSVACARCHGASGYGSVDAPQASSYAIDGKTYPFPVPGINGEPGNFASDPLWNTALFAFAARANVDNHGVSLRPPMPNALGAPAGGQSLTTQDFADMLAFLRTQLE